MDNNSAVSVIREELKKRKMTYKELSRISGVPLDTLNNFFRGKTKNPRIDTVLAIERALCIRVSDGITEADRVAGADENITVTVTADIYEWVEIGENIKEEKGKEFFESLKKVVREIGKKS